MIENIIDRRYVDDGVHKMELQVSKNEFDDVYSNLNQDIAKEVILRYLDNKADDGRPENIGFGYDSNSNIVKLTAELKYTGNEHTEFFNNQ